MKTAHILAEAMITLCACSFITGCTTTQIGHSATKTVYIKSTPVESIVSLDGVNIGTTPHGISLTNRMEAYRISCSPISSEGYGSSMQSILFVETRNNQILTFDLPKIVKIEADSGRYEVIVNGESLGSTPILFDTSKTRASSFEIKFKPSQSTIASACSRRGVDYIHWINDTITYQRNSIPSRIPAKVDFVTKEELEKKQEQALRMLEILHRGNMDVNVHHW